MKKFKFSLETVLSYDKQVLERLEREHNEIRAKVKAQEDVLEEIKRRYREYGDEYSERCGSGLQITEARVYQIGLRAMEREIEYETDVLAKLRVQEEKKRAEVIDMKRDVSGVEKLKEKKLKEYNKASEKSEEIFIEDLISAGRVRSAAGIGV